VLKTTTTLKNAENRCSDWAGMAVHDGPEYAKIMETFTKLVDRYTAQEAAYYTIDAESPTQF